MIHREGYTIIAGTVVLIGVFGWLIQHYLSDYRVLSYGLYAILLFFLVMVVQFFRNPTRNTLIDPQTVIAPADGKVVIIEEVDEPEYFQGEKANGFHFYVANKCARKPKPGKWHDKILKYHPGEYLVAWHPKSSTLNERTSIVIENEAGIPVLFRQIAGALARRIRWYVKEGDTVVQGQEFGFIKFGSRIDIYLPVGTDVKVALGDKYGVAKP